MTFDIEKIRIGVIGLGYVGLPLATEFGRKYPTVGFDVKKSRVAELESGRDSTLEVSADELKLADKLEFTTDPAALSDCNFYIVTVPTPIGDGNRPLLTPLRMASITIGGVLKPGDIVVYESTVYPGATEEFCVPFLEQESGLKLNEDFYVGYSPERINPGDKEHRLPTILKVTSGSTPEVADYIDAVYRTIITAGTHKASSIKVAEAAKVIENTQRDLAAPGPSLLELGDRVLLAWDPGDAVTVPDPAPPAGDIGPRRRGPWPLGHECRATRDCERQTGDQDCESSHESSSLRTFYSNRPPGLPRSFY